MSSGRSSLTPKHLLDRVSNYDAAPFVASGPKSECAVGWESIAQRLRAGDPRRIVVETYTGVSTKDILSLIDLLSADIVINSTEALKSESEIDAMVAADVTDDPVFGFISRLRLADFFDARKLKELRDRMELTPGRVVVHGPGASLITQGDVLVYADMPRWEGQLRQRRNEAANLGTANFSAKASLQYKRSFFVDWRVLDRHKRTLREQMDHVLDTTDSHRPKMISAQSMLTAMDTVSRRPFRVVPYFDPAPWGGSWMQKVCGIEHDGPNLGWCFDCVVEENSLLLGFGDERFEIPSVNLVFTDPVDLLGEAVHGRFGAEFPIRFDFLDTMGGGNLSFQVHPLTEYIRQNFGMSYTQDESYYLLDAGPDATVYLGVKSGISPQEMIDDLHKAARGGSRFPDERYVNRFPAKRHDHFLIPAGTVHCSGANSMVLEISATPYIFTFKLWDWDRLGLNGVPRPVHIEHGAASIQWNRDTEYCQAELVNRVTEVGRGEGWIEEVTGLHKAEFIETRRHWFTKPVAHQRSGSVDVLNLVEGEEAMVESLDGAFEPFPIHYAETFIVPAAAGPYLIRPSDRVHPEQVHATVKASVRI